MALLAVTKPHYFLLILIRTACGTMYLFFISSGGVIARRIT